MTKKAASPLLKWTPRHRDSGAMAHDKDKDVWRRVVQDISAIAAR